MGILSGLLRPTLRADASPANEGVWSSSLGAVGGQALSGVYVSADTALTASPVWGCVRLLAESLASLPIIIYRRRSDGGKERAANHPLYELLHDQPNTEQTSFEWKRAMMVHALLWGAGHSRTWSGPRGAVDRMELLDPDSVQTEKLPRGKYRYKVTGGNGRPETVNAEDIFHIPGLSVDGVTGLSLMNYARESVGLYLAAGEYSARTYSQDARPGGVLKSPKVLTAEAAKRLGDTWQQAHAGLGKAHKVAVLEEGVEWEAIGMTNQEAQLISQLDWSVADIARFFNVPLHMIQQMTKSTSWGSGIEEMGIEFVTYSLLPWVRCWEGMIRKDLILAPRTYFAEFLMEGLLRGKQGDRYTAYATGRQWGWLSVNDIRGLENLNPIPGGDVYLQPLNMVPAGAQAQGPEAMEHYQLLLRETAARVVRKEIAAMGRAARRADGDEESWSQAVSEFYSSHAGFVGQTLGIGQDEAERYVREQQAALLTQGPDAMDGWEGDRVVDLMALATEARDG